MARQTTLTCVQCSRSAFALRLSMIAVVSSTPLLAKLWTWLTVFRLSCLQSQPSVRCLLCPSSSHAKALAHLRVDCSLHGFQWQVPVDDSALFQLTFPSHLLPALGWTMLCTGRADAAAGSVYMTFALIPHSALAISVAQLRHLQRLWLFRARLQSESNEGRGTCVQAVVKVVAQEVWSGPLPGRLQLSSLYDMWAASSTLLRLRPASRLFSGPYHQNPEACVAEIQARSTGVLRVKPTGTLVLTIHPEIRGGGQKREVKSWAASRALLSVLSRACVWSRPRFLQAPFARK